MYSPGIYFHILWHKINISLISYPWIESLILDQTIQPQYICLPEAKFESQANISLENQCLRLLTVLKFQILWKYVRKKIQFLLNLCSFFILFYKANLSCGVWIVSSIWLISLLLLWKELVCYWGCKLSIFSQVSPLIDVLLLTIFCEKLFNINRKYKREKNKCF